ncbi:alpha/beta hydrolase [Cellulomonas sp. P4]|uniref:alpha/beta hydrolase n=1 Tax=Cellulomonas sp. P4 TaxID=3142533 RepID=UPI0031B9F0EC
MTARPVTARPATARPATTRPARPAVDPELAALLAGMPDLPTLSAESLPLIRPYAVGRPATVLAGRAVRRRETEVAAADGTSLPLTVLSPAEQDAAQDATPSGPGAPAVLWLHGGGMVMGDRFSQVDIPLEWLDALGSVVVTVDYRLAPEVTGTTIVEDGYRALVWLADHAAELGVDPDRVVVAGTSAGGGLAAGVVLLARDLGGPAVAAQVLVCPMLDHRSATTSARQFTGPGVWSLESNRFAWSAVLGAQPADVPASVSPSVAADLAGLPAAYLDAGSAEVFRDEVVDYASRIWAAGGQAELHVWAGGFHGFDALFPDAAVSRAARASRLGWLRRVLREG